MSTNFWWNREKKSQKLNYLNIVPTFFIPFKNFLNNFFQTKTIDGNCVQLQGKTPACQSAGFLEPYSSDCMHP